MENTATTTKLNDGTTVLAGKDGYAVTYTNRKQAMARIEKLAVEGVAASIRQPLFGRVFYIATEAA